MTVSPCLISTSPSPLHRARTDFLNGVEGSQEVHRERCSSRYAPEIQTCDGGPYVGTPPRPTAHSCPLASGGRLGYRLPSAPCCRPFAGSDFDSEPTQPTLQLRGLTHSLSQLEPTSGQPQRTPDRASCGPRVQAGVIFPSAVSP